MGIPLEGVIDSVIPRLKAAEWTPWGDGDDGEDFFFRGKFYGIRAKLMVSVKPETKMVTSAYITVGPYSTQQMLERNFQYFLHKMKQEHGELKQHDNAWVGIGDEGSVKLSIVDNDNGSHDIRVLYLSAEDSTVLFRR